MEYRSAEIRLLLGPSPCHLSIVAVWEKIAMFISGRTQKKAHHLLETFETPQGVDFHRTATSMSIANNNISVLLPREGWKAPRLEEIIKLDETPQISPWHLMPEYVARTPRGGGGLCCGP